MLENNKVLVMAEIAILTALAVGLDFLAGIFFSLPNGGSVSIAMVPIMLISFRRGVIHRRLSVTLFSNLVSISRKVLSIFKCWNIS